MTTVSEPDKSASDPRTTGFFAKLMSKAYRNMTPDERTEVMQDAAAMTAGELGKAHDNMMTVDSAHTGFIEDHWSDSPQDVVKVVETGGPGSSVPSGSIGVGPSQEASGNGGPRMEARYSRHAPQSGLQTATEKLGRDILGIRGTMKAIISAVQGVNAQVELLKAASVSPSPAADLQAQINDAVAKAMAPVKAELQKAIATAALTKADDGPDDEEAKAAAITAAKAEDWKKEKDDEDDKDDDKKESSKAAAELRLMAKARIIHAKLRLAKAQDYAAEEKGKAAQRAMTLANINLAKAQESLNEATALRDGKVGLSTQIITRDIARVKKSLDESTVSMQDIWPATTEAQDHVGKAAESAVAETVKAPPVPNPDLAKAVAQIEAAATGMGMMTASVADLFKALSGQTKPVEVTDVSGERHNLPPVFALAKAGASELATREAELARLRDTNVISFEDHDRARDALTRVRMGLPEETIKAMVDRLPDAARAVLTRAAA